MTLARAVLLLSLLSGAAFAASLDEADGLFRQREYAKALQAYQAALEKDAASGRAAAGVIRCLLLQHDIAGASSASQRFTASLSGSADVHEAYGEVLLRKGQLAEAEKQFREALQADPKQARAWLGLGTLAEASSMRQAAERYFQQAISLDGFDQQIVFTWMSVQRLAGRPIIIVHDPNAAQSVPASPASDPVEMEDASPRCQIISPYAKHTIPMHWLLSDAHTLRGFGVSVAVNGNKAQNLMLDTGAHGILMTSKAAAKAGVRRLHDQQISGIGDQGPREGYVGVAESIKVGEVEFRNCPVEVSDRKNLVDEDGLAGIDLFRDYVVRLDLPKNKMTLSPLPGATAPPAEPQDRMNPPEMKGFTRFFHIHHYLLIPTLVNESHSGLFLLDTGALASSITPAFAREVTKVGKDDGIIVKGISGKVDKVFSADQAVMQFGNLRQRNDDLTSFSLDNISDSAGVEVSGIIGMTALVRLAITVDFRDGLINFEYEGH